MKICFLTDAWTPVWGGGQEHIWQISNRLVSGFDCQVDILVPNIKSFSGKLFPKVEGYLGGNLRLIRVGQPFIFPNLFGRLYFLLSATRFLLSANTYDIYHSHSFSTSLLIPILKLFKNGKFVFTLHGLGFKGLGAGIFNYFAIPQILQEIILYHFPYDDVLTVEKNSLKYGKLKHFRVVGNGVNFSEFDKIPKKAGRNDKQFTIIWVGRFDPKKRVEDLILAVDRLKSLKPKIKLHLIGDGTEKQQAEKLVSSRHLQSFIKFKGFLSGETLIKEYKSADLFVLCSISEGLPLTLLEAMAAKLPIITTDVGNCKEVVTAANAGLVISPNDADALSQSIVSMINNSQLRKLGESGHKFVQSHYSWEKVTKYVYGSYETLFNQ